MPRKKFEFTGKQQVRIIDLVSEGKNYDEITAIFNDEFGKVSRSTIVNLIKELGLKIKDVRGGKSIEVSDEVKDVIKTSYGMGVGIDTIVKDIYTLTKTEVSSYLVKEIIKKEGYVKGKRLEFDFDSGFGDEDELTSEIDKIEYPMELLEKMSKDSNLKRLNDYFRRTPYMYEGQTGTSRENGKDTWYDRDGIIRIYTTRSMYYYNDYTDYETAGGSFYSQHTRESDMRLFTVNGDSRSEALDRKSKEICKWYKSHISEINKLYDVIVEKRYSNCPEVVRFNEICGRLYSMKNELMELVLGKGSSQMRRITGNCKEDSFEAFTKYMKSECGSDWCGDESELKESESDS